MRVHDISRTTFLDGETKFVQDFWRGFMGE